MAKKTAKKQVTKRIVSLSLDIEMMKKFQTMALSQRRSLSFIVEQCLLDWLEFAEQRSSTSLIPNEGVEKLVEQLIGPTFMNNLKFLGARAVSLYADHTGISVKLGAKSRNAGPDEPLMPVDGEIKFIMTPEGQYSAQINATFDSVVT